MYGLEWEQAGPVLADRIYDVHMIAETGSSRTWARPDRPPLLKKEQILSLMKEHYKALPEGDGLDRLLGELGVRYVVFGDFERELPGATDARLESGGYRLCFQSNGHRIYERTPRDGLAETP
jgi:hypothetical protein